MHHLVVGGTGFIGGHLVEHLLERGGHVRVLARRPDRPAWLATPAELVQGDLNDPRALTEQVQGADIVYATTPLPSALPDETAAQAVLDQTLRGLVHACHQARVTRLVYLSGIDVYEPRLPNRPITEEFPTRPASPAGRLRLAAEHTLSAAAASVHVPLVIIRPVTVFGPRDHTFTSPLLQTYDYPPGPALPGGGRARLSLVYVKDVARALATAARHPAAEGQVFHVSGFATTWRAFVAALCAELEVAPPAPGPPASLASLLDWCAHRLSPPRGPVRFSRYLASTMTRTRLFSDEKLVSLLGYHPAYDLLAGVSETVGWYRGLARSVVVAGQEPTANVLV